MVEGGGGIQIRHHLGNAVGIFFASTQLCFKGNRRFSGFPILTQPPRIDVQFRGHLFIGRFAIQGFAQLANQTIPESVLANLRPLRSLLVYGSRDGDIQNVVVYLKTNPS